MNELENSELKFRFLFCFVCLPNAPFFQMFIVLWMYDFAGRFRKCHKKPTNFGPTPFLQNGVKGFLEKPNIFIIKGSFFAYCHLPKSKIGWLSYFFFWTDVICIVWLSFLVKSKKLWIVWKLFWTSRRTKIKSSWLA